MKNIYIIQNTKNKNIKIGVTSNITKRLSSLQCGSDYKLEVKFLSAPVKNVLKIESAIHNEFKRENTHGEWFELNIDKAISKIKETIKLYGKIELLLPGDTKLIREKNRRILKSKADKYFKESTKGIRENEKLKNETIDNVKQIILQAKEFKKYLSVDFLENNKKNFQSLFFSLIDIKDKLTGEAKELYADILQEEIYEIMEKVAII